MMKEQMYTKLDNHTFIFEAKILLNEIFSQIAEIEEEDFVKISREVETLAGLIWKIKAIFLPKMNELITTDTYSKL